MPTTQDPPDVAVFGGWAEPKSNLQAHKIHMKACTIDAQTRWREQIIEMMETMAAAAVGCGKRSLKEASYMMEAGKGAGDG